MSTAETAETLVERLSAAGKWPEPSLLSAILERGSEAVEPLRALIRKDVTTMSERTAIGFGADLLGSLGDPSTIPDLLDLFRRYVMNEDDLLVCVQEALRTFGPQVLEPELEIVLDRTLPWYPRSVALEAAQEAAGDDLAAHARVAEVVRSLLAQCLSEGPRDPSDDGEMVSWLVATLSEMADPLARDVIAAAFRAKAVAPYIITEDDVENDYRAGNRKSWGETDSEETWLSHYEKQYAHHVEWKNRQVETRPERAPQPYQSRPSVAQARPTSLPVTTLRNDKTRPGRNDPCWCGSGKKYKQCHLQRDQAQ